MFGTGFFQEIYLKYIRNRIHFDYETMVAHTILVALNHTNYFFSGNLLLLIPNYSLLHITKDYKTNKERVKDMNMFKEFKESKMHGYHGDGYLPGNNNIFIGKS